MQGQDLIERIRAESGEVVELLRELVELESPSTSKVLVDQVGGLIVRRLEESGLIPNVVPRREAGNPVWAEWGGGGPGRILVLCHIDTVWEAGSLKKNPFRLENGRIFGPGIFDMKAGVAATLKVQEYLKKGWIVPLKKVRFLYTTDEELTSSHSRDLIEESAKASDLVLVIEPPLPGGELKTSRKGVSCYVIRIRGRAAHSGLEPEKGISAVEELARQIGSVQALAAPDRGSTVMVTMVRGGSAPNVVPDCAEATVDVRFRTAAEAQRIHRSIRELQPNLEGIVLEVEGGIDRSPMERTGRSAALFETAREVAAELGIRLGEGESGGGSDGNLTAALGVPTLDGLGIPGDGAHAVHEHILADELAPRIALLALLIERL